MGGGVEQLIGFAAQVSPGEAVIAAGLPLVCGGLNGAIGIKKIGEGGAEDVPLLCVGGPGACGAGDRQCACGWIINGGDGQADGLGCGVTIVIGDGDGEGIVAVEVGIGCVGPGTGFGVNGSGTVAGAVAGCDGEVGGISEAVSGISS